jgi:hypothetical protein
LRLRLRYEGLRSTAAEDHTLRRARSEWLTIDVVP